MPFTVPVESDRPEVNVGSAYSWEGSALAGKGERRKSAATHRPVAYSYPQRATLKRQIPAAHIVIVIDADAQRWLKFKALVAQWRVERGATSSITAMAMCDAYQKIIAMGPRAVPLIIAQMRSELPEPDQWFWALQVLTNVDPVAETDRGDFVKMAQSWIEWVETSWEENESYDR